MPKAVIDEMAPRELRGPTTKKAQHHLLTSHGVTLRDGSEATIYPVLPSTLNSAPGSLIEFLSNEFNKEIEAGDTYPMDELTTLEDFKAYWFGNFTAIVLKGRHEKIEEGRDWTSECLGTFYIKPNYVGRCSSVANAGFLVTPAARNKGVGKFMGQTFIEYAPLLGYRSSVFNLVFESNVASIRLWKSLGFKEIGRVEKAGRLRGQRDYQDAIIFGYQFTQNHDLDGLNANGVFD